MRIRTSFFPGAGVASSSSLRTSLITALDHACAVIAPSLIPRRAGVRVKTDRTDARHLVRLLRAGELTCVRVPSPAEEAARDLIRVREEVKTDRRIARQRIRSFLPRYGERYPDGPDRWSHRFGVSGPLAHLHRALCPGSVPASSGCLLHA